MTPSLSEHFRRLSGFSKTRYPAALASEIPFQNNQREQMWATRHVTFLRAREPLVVAAGDEEFGGTQFSED